MGHVQLGGKAGRPAALIAALVLAGLAGAARVAAAPLWEMTFTMGGSPAATFGRGVRWTRRPADSEVFALYPAEAFRERISGAVLLECAPTAEGKLADCAVIEEKPEGKGFAQASLAVLKLYEFGPRERITPAMLEKKMRLPFVWGMRRNLTREVRP